MNQIEKNTIHPKHYKKEGRAECWDELILNYGEFAVFCFDICNAHKYMYRAGEKEGNPREQDLAKIKNYVKHAEERIGNISLKDMPIADKLLKQLKENLERDGIDYGRNE